MKTSVEGSGEEAGDQKSHVELSQSYGTTAGEGLLNASRVVRQDGEKKSFPVQAGAEWKRSGGQIQPRLSILHFTGQSLTMHLQGWCLWLKKNELNFGVDRGARQGTNLTSGLFLFFAKYWERRTGHNKFKGVFKGGE